MTGRGMDAVYGIFGGAAIVYMGVVAAMFAFQRNLMYHPHGDAVAPAAVGVPEMTEVRPVAEDGLAVMGWYAPPPDQRAPVVVVFHGNAGHLSMRADKARRLLDAGFGVFLAGYRGFEGNDGRPSEEGLYRDGRAALDWLAGRDVPAARVVVYGESLGTGVAVQMATEYPVAGVVLEAPFTAIADVAAEVYPWVPVRWLTLDRYDSLGKIAALRAPLLLLHGERDDVVPVRLGRRLFEAAPGPKRALILPGANHVDLYDHGVGAEVVAFVRDLAGAEPAPQR